MSRACGAREWSGWLAKLRVASGVKSLLNRSWPHLGDSEMLLGQGKEGRGCLISYSFYAKGMKSAGACDGGFSVVLVENARIMVKAACGLVDIPMMVRLRWCPRNPSPAALCLNQGRGSTQREASARPDLCSPLSEIVTPSLMRRSSSTLLPTRYENAYRSNSAPCRPSSRI
jgi:hypothetical protein